MRKIFLLLSILVVAFISCGPNSSNTDTREGKDTLTGKLVIFHAGSLSVPVKAICDSFKLIHPGVEILCEAAGSKECARKICNLGKSCDVILSADYNVIQSLLIPEWADWNIKFVSNEMAIVFTAGSKRAKEIDSNNWYNILMAEDVIFSRSDPNSDPCGVRALMTMQLAEKYYNENGLYERMKEKDTKYMRPKETDLLALLESGTVDYIFLYKSVAEQHKMKYLLLPDEINLKKPELEDYYASAVVETIGKKPGETVLEAGAPMLYGLTIPKNSPSPELAKAFVYFLLSDGMKIMADCGQPSVVPSPTSTYDKIPTELKVFALPQAVQ